MQTSTGKLVKGSAPSNLLSFQTQVSGMAKREKSRTFWATCSGSVDTFVLRIFSSTSGFGASPRFPYQQMWREPVTTTHGFFVVSEIELLFSTVQSGFKKAFGWKKQNDSSNFHSQKKKRFGLKPFETLPALSTSSMAFLTSSNGACKSSKLIKCFNARIVPSKAQWL